MNTCCFIGHRKICINNKLLSVLKDVIKKLIDIGITTFYFGSRSRFDDLCLQIVTEFKSVYPKLIRIFVRAEYEYINQDYEDYLLKCYDQTYFSNKAHNAGKLVYIKRNEEIINKSNICVFYFNETYKPTTNKSSGTKIAFDYANYKNKTVINIVDLINS